MNFLQSKYWKESKKNLGNQVYDVGEYFFHTTPLPLIGKNIGYMPRPDLNKINWEELYKKAKEASCVYLTIDPDNLKSENIKLPNNFKFAQGSPIHLQENTIIDLTKSNEELFSSMKQKHRYNLNLAKKKGVEVKISNSEDAFAEFLKLYEDTVIRQQYHGRSRWYIETVWKTLENPQRLDAGDQKLETSVQESGATLQYPEFNRHNLENKLETIATAYYQGKSLASWFLFLFEDTIYYPYGGSSDEDKNIMAPYTLVWEIIQWGKQNGYKKFDLWGIKSIGKSESGEVQFDGFSRFKVGFGGEIIEYTDTVDFVIDKNLYSLVKTLAQIRSKLIFR